MMIVKTIISLWKEALKSEKILNRKALQQKQRRSRSFNEFTLERRLITEEWSHFEKDESLFRRRLLSLLMIQSLYVWGAIKPGVIC